MGRQAHSLATIMLRTLIAVIMIYSTSGFTIGIHSPLRPSSGSLQSVRNSKQAVARTATATMMTTPTEAREKIFHDIKGAMAKVSAWVAGTEKPAEAGPTA